MALFSKCSNAACKQNTSFELATLRIENAPHPFEVIRCVGCGSVAGVLPSAQLLAINDALRSMVGSKPMAEISAVSRPQRMRPLL